MTFMLETWALTMLPDLVTRILIHSLLLESSVTTACWPFRCIQSFFVKPPRSTVEPFVYSAVPGCETIVFELPLAARSLGFVFVLLRVSWLLLFAMLKKTCCQDIWSKTEF